MDSPWKFRIMTGGVDYLDVLTCRLRRVKSQTIAGAGIGAKRRHGASCDLRERRENLFSFSSRERRDTPPAWERPTHTHAHTTTVGRWWVVQASEESHWLVLSPLDSTTARYDDDEDDEIIWTTWSYSPPRDSRLSSGIHVRGYIFYTSSYLSHPV